MVRNVTFNFKGLTFHVYVSLFEDGGPSLADYIEYDIESIEIPDGDISNLQEIDSFKFECALAEAYREAEEDNRVGMYG